MCGGEDAGAGGQEVRNAGGRRAACGGGGEHLAEYLKFALQRERDERHARRGNALLAPGGGRHAGRHDGRAGAGAGDRERARVGGQEAHAVRILRAAPGGGARVRPAGAVRGRVAWLAGETRAAGATEQLRVVRLAQAAEDGDDGKDGQHGDGGQHGD